jgi:hypothetical protein
LSADNITYQDSSTVTGGRLQDIKVEQQKGALKGAQLLARCLQLEGVDVLFGYKVRYMRHRVMRVPVAKSVFVSRLQVLVLLILLPESPMRGLTQPQLLLLPGMYLLIYWVRMLFRKSILLL